MIVNREEYESRKPEIDLVGPDGNAFRLMAYAKNFARQLNMDFEPIQKDMMSGDYEHL